jgi:hypothetical protein
MRRPDLFTAASQRLPLSEGRSDACHSEIRCRRICLPDLLYVLLSCVYIFSACIVYDPAHGIPNP